MSYSYMVKHKMINCTSTSRPRKTTWQRKKRTLQKNKIKINQDQKAHQTEILKQKQKKFFAAPQPRPSHPIRPYITSTACTQSYRPLFFYVSSQTATAITKVVSNSTSSSLVGHWCASASAKPSPPKASTQTGRATPTNSPQLPQPKSI